MVGSWTPPASARSGSPTSLPSDVVAAFGDLAAAIEECPRGCAHLGPPSDPECALDTEVAAGRLGAGRLDALRRVLTALRTPAWETGG